MKHLPPGEESSAEALLPQEDKTGQSASTIAQKSLCRSQVASCVAWQTGCTAENQTDLLQPVKSKDPRRAFKGLGRQWISPLESRAHVHMKRSMFCIRKLTLASLCTVHVLHKISNAQDRELTGVSAADFMRISYFLQVQTVLFIQAGLMDLWDVLSQGTAVSFLAHANTSQQLRDWFRFGAVEWLSRPRGDSS